MHAFLPSNFLVAIFISSSLDLLPSGQHSHQWTALRRKIILYMFFPVPYIPRWHHVECVNEGADDRSKNHQRQRFTHT